MYPVDVRVSTVDDVSREHARIRREPSTGALFLIDLSTHGTTVDERPVPRGFDEVDGRKRENGAEVQLPARARIGLAKTVFIDFERL
jgi:pSer/pThr/pTyr-binding forkhead associated (FHA) protein